MNTYYFELTDTFGGELNYCHLSRFIINAKSLRGALIKLSKHTGLNFRKTGLYYKAKKACLAAYEIDYEIDTSWLDRSEFIK